MSNDLIPLENPNVPALFAPGGLVEIINKIEEDALALVPDLSTAKGRDAIASNAARVARSKTYLDGLGKDYVARLKDLPRQIDSERKAMRDRLDALRDKVRLPLTEWENAEHERAALTERLIINLGGSVPMGTPVAKIEARLQAAMDTEIPDSLHPEQRDLVANALANAVTLLQAALDTARRAEAEAAELARLRLAAAEAERAERQRKAEAEAEEKARIAAEAKAKADLERAERAKIEAERRAAESERRLKQEQADTEERQRVAIAQAVAREAERIETEQRMAAEKVAREQAAAEAAAQAAANRAAIDAQIIDRLRLVAEITERQATGILQAILDGDVPHVIVKY